MGGVWFYINIINSIFLISQCGVVLLFEPLSFFYLFYRINMSIFPVGKF